MISINTNIKSFINVLAKEAQLQNKAFISALNKTAEQGRTAAKKSIREEYTVTAKAINKRQSTYIKKAYENHHVSKIVAEGQGMALGYFQKTKKPEGVEVRVMKAHAGKVIPGSFILNLKSGHKGVFVRAKASTVIGRNLVVKGGKITGRGKWLRSNAGDPFGYGNKRVGKYPVDQLLGPGAASMLKSKRVWDKTINYIVTNFKRIHENEIRFYTQFKK